MEEYWPNIFINRLILTLSS